MQNRELNIHSKKKSTSAILECFNRKSAVKYPFLYFALLMLMCLSLTLVYCIPSELMKTNIDSSFKTVIEEGTYPKSYIGEPFDNATVIKMLSTAAIDGSGNPFTAAMTAPLYSNSDLNLIHMYSISNESNTISYAKYWNGYLVFLKPLLIFLDIKQIRLLIQTVFYLLLAIVCILFGRRWGTPGIIASISMVISLSLVGSADAVATLPIAPSFIVAVLGSLWIASFVKDHGLQSTSSKSSLYFAFFLLGSITVFFDFLDNPILTYGFPIVTLIVLANRDTEKDGAITFSLLIRVVLLSLIFWTFGYGITWSIKWILASLASGQNMFHVAWESILFRTGIDNGDGSFTYGTPIFAATVMFSVLKFAMYLVYISIAILLCYYLFAIFLHIKQKNQQHRLNEMPRTIALCIVSLTPQLWFLIASNHTIIHGMISYRTQVITLFALFCAAGLAIKDIRARVIEHKQRMATPLS